MGSVGGVATPDIANLAVVIGADTSGAEAGFARVHAGIGVFATGAAAALTGASVAIVGAGQAAVKSAADFEATMSGVKAVSGATNQQMQQLSGLALQLGKDTAFSASEAASGIEELVKGGLTIPDIMNGAAKATLDLAAAGGVSLPDAATIAANALAEFNLKGNQMAHVADLIAGAANASALDVSQFKFSLQAAGAVAATIGFSFDDLAVAIAEMGKAGITGSDAGTSLKTMMLNLTPSTKTATEEMRKLGIITKDGANQFFDAHGKAKSLADVQQVLQNATKGMTDQQRLASLQILFGTDAIRAAAVLAKEGAAGYREMAGDMGKVTAASVGLERLNNLNGDMQTLGGSVETLAITFGTAFLPALRDATQWVTNLVNGLIPIAQQYGPIVVGMLQHLGEAVSDLLKAGDVGVFADDMREAFGIDLTAFVEPIRAIETAIGGIATAFSSGGLGAAFGAFLTQAQTFGPAVLGWAGDLAGQLAAKVADWGAALIGWVAPRVPGVLAALETAGVSLLGWITGTALPQIVDRLSAWGSALVGWIAPAVAPMLAEAGTLAVALWSWITTTALPTIKTKLLDWGSAFVAWVTPLVTSLPGALAGVATAVVTWVGQQVAPLATTLAGWASAFVAWATPIAAQIPGALLAIGTAALTWVGQQIEPLGKKLGEWGAAFVDWATPLVKGLPAKLGDVKDAVWAWITTTAPLALTKLGEWKDAFLNWVTPLVVSLPTKLGEAKDAAITWIGVQGPLLLAKLGEWGTAFLGWVAPLLAALPAELLKIKTALVTWITDTAIPAMKTAWDKLQPTIVPVIVGALQAARDGLKPVWTDITTFMSDFEPTGLRLERLFNTIATAITGAAGILPALKQLWPSGTGQGPSFFQVLATEVNALSGKWEKLIDDFGTSATKINDFYKSTKPFWDVLEKLLPGGAGAGLAPGIADLIGRAAQQPSGGGGGGGGGVTVVPGAPHPQPGETVVGGPDPANGKYAYQRRNPDGGTVVEWRDQGGIGMPGRPYAIGVPEVFVPNTPGRFVPLGGAGYGGPTTVQVSLMLDRQVLARVNAELGERRARRGDR